MGLHFGKVSLLHPYQGASHGCYGKAIPELVVTLLSGGIMPGRPGHFEFCFDRLSTAAQCRFRAKTPVCERWQRQESPHGVSHRNRHPCSVGIPQGARGRQQRPCVPVSQCALEQKHHSRQAQTRRRERRRAGVSPQVKIHLCHAITQRGLQSDIHSTISRSQGTLQHDGVRSRS
jgi:hypothetical protein